MRTLITVLLIVAALAVAWWAWQRYAPATMGGSTVAVPSFGDGAVPSTIGAGVKPSQGPTSTFLGTSSYVLPGFKA